MFGECSFSEELEMFLELSPDPKLVCDCRRLLAKLSGMDCRSIHQTASSAKVTKPLQMVPAFAADVLGSRCVTATCNGLAVRRKGRALNLKCTNSYLGDRSRVAKSIICPSTRVINPPAKFISIPFLASQPPHKLPNSPHVVS